MSPPQTSATRSARRRWRVSGGGCAWAALTAGYSAALSCRCCYCSHCMLLVVMPHLPACLPACSPARLPAQRCEGG